MPGKELMILRLFGLHHVLFEIFVCHFLLKENSKRKVFQPYSLKAMTDDLKTKQCELK